MEDDTSPKLVAEHGGKPLQPARVTWGERRRGLDLDRAKRPTRLFDDCIHLESIGGAVVKDGRTSIADTRLLDELHQDEVLQHRPQGAFHRLSPPRAGGGKKRGHT